MLGINLIRAKEQILTSFQLWVLLSGNDSAGLLSDSSAMCMLDRKENKENECLLCIIIYGIVFTRWLSVLNKVWHFHLIDKQLLKNWRGFFYVSDFQKVSRSTLSHYNDKKIKWKERRILVSKKRLFWLWFCLFVLILFLMGMLLLSQCTSPTASFITPEIYCPWNILSAISSTSRLCEAT